MKVKYLDFGKRLTELRKAKALKQKECLEGLGEPTLQMLCSWEKGYSFPSLNYLKNIAKFYDVSLDYLVFGIQKDSPMSQLTTYSEVFSFLMRVLNTDVFDYSISEDFGLDHKYLHIDTPDKIVINFFEKLNRLNNSKDLYGESKYEEALDALIESYKDEIKH